MLKRCCNPYISPYRHTWLQGRTLFGIAEGYTLYRLDMPHGVAEKLYTFHDNPLDVVATAAYVIVATTAEVYVFKPCGALCTSWRLPNDSWPMIACAAGNCLYLQCGDFLYRYRDPAQSADVAVRTMPGRVLVDAVSRSAIAVREEDELDGPVKWVEFDRLLGPGRDEPAGYLPALPYELLDESVVRSARPDRLARVLGHLAPAGLVE